MRKTALKVRSSRWREIGPSQRQDDDEILGSRLRSDVHVTSGRRPPVRRRARGCWSSLLIVAGSQFFCHAYQILF